MKPVSKAVLPLGLFIAASAHAQSSITLYGVVDAGIAYIHNAKGADGKNGSTLLKFSSGNMTGSRWGLKGNEDIGGGLAAVFQLEGGFNIGTGMPGQGGREFGRRAFMGLSDRQWGSVLLGRQYDPIVDLVQPLTEDVVFSEVFATPGDLDNYDNTMRVNNSIKYVSPAFAGLQVEAIYGPGGVAGAAGSRQTVGVGASYRNGPFAVAAGYLYAHGGNTATKGVRTWDSSADSLFNTVINQGFASARSLQIVQAAAQYTTGALSAGVGYSNTQYTPDGLSAFRTPATYNVGSVFVNYLVMPSLRTGVSYNYTSLTGPASAHYNQINFGADYTLTKRTDLYLLMGYQKASGNTLNASGAVIPAQASIGSYGVSAGTDNQMLAIAGIRHKF